MNLRAWLGFPVCLLGMTILHVGILIAVGGTEAKRFWGLFAEMMDEL